MKKNLPNQTLKIDLRALDFISPASGIQKKPIIRVVKNKPDYAYLHENSYDAILHVNKDGNVLNANTKAMQLFGNEFLSDKSSVFDLIVGTNPTILTQITDVVKANHFARIQAFAKYVDDRTGAVEIVVMASKNPFDGTYCFFIRDIQSRWHAENKLNSAFQAMNNTDVGIMAVDLEGKVSYTNRMMRFILTGSADALPENANISEWFDAEKIVTPMLETVSAGGHYVREEKFEVAGNTYYFYISAVPDLNEDKEIMGLVVSMRDVSDRRKAELAEFQLERDRVMMNSLSEACHAIGQPATVLLTGIEILKSTDKSDTQTMDEMIDLCYSAVLELRERLKEMNAARMSVKGSMNPDGISEPKK